MRTALDTSREELRRLKEFKLQQSQQQQQQKPDDPSDGLLGETLERLALENHVLRRKLLIRSVDSKKSDAATSPRISSTIINNNGDRRIIAAKSIANSAATPVADYTPCSIQTVQ